MTPASSSPVPPDDLLAHAGFVRGLARALVSGDADVDDVVQETWVAALGSQNSTIRSPRSWLASIVRRRAARHHRTRARIDKRHAEGATTVEVPTPDDLAARHETIQKVSAALAALPANYRDVLVLRYYEELPPREVARRLDIPVETARTRIRRGLVRLREILDEKHDGRRVAWAAPLAGLVSSGAAGAGIGTVVVGGLAVAAVLVLGFALAPWPWGDKAPPPIEQADRRPDGVRPPTLMGRGEAEGDAVEVSDVAAPSAARIETPARIGEEPQSKDTETDRVEVHVRVVDEKGQPVEGIGLKERTRDPSAPVGGRHRHLGRTDGQGHAVVSVATDAIAIGIERSDQWHCDERHGVPDAGEEILIRVVRSIAIQGVVLNEKGAPLGGKHVHAKYKIRTSPGTTALQIQQVGPTDEHGRFIAHVPAYVVEVHLVAHADGATATSIVSPTTQRDVILRIARKVTIRGTVWGPDGSPITSPDVDALPMAGGPEIGGGIRGDQETNDFFIDVPSRGPYLLRFVPEGVSTLAWPEPVVVEAPAEGIRIVCPVGHRIDGRVEGDDVERFQVGWIRHRRDDPRLTVRRFTRTDPGGRFSLNGLVDGDSVLYLHRPGDGRYGLVERVRLPADDLVVALQRGQTIRGRVRGYTGRHGFGLALRFTWRGPSIHVDVEEDGTFTVTGLPPATYGVRWQRAGKQGDLDLKVEAGNEEVEVVLPEEVLRMGQTPGK